MDRRSLLAVALSIVVLVIWQVLFAPKPKPRLAPAPAATPALAEAEKPAGPEPAPEEPREPEPASANPVPGEIGAGERKEFIISTENYSIRFSNEGGRILSWRLLRYVDDLKAPLELVPREVETLDDFPLKLTLPGDEATTKRLQKALFQEDVHDATPQDAWPGGAFTGKIVSFTWSDGQGLVATKRIAIPRSGYVNEGDAALHRGGAPEAFELTWAVGLPESADDKSSRYFHVQGQGVVLLGGKNLADRYPARLAADTRSFPGAGPAGTLLWGGLESTYFTSLLIPEKAEATTFSLVPIRPPGPGGAPAPAADTLLAARISGKGEARFTAVVGPKDYDLLAGLDRELDHVIDFSRFGLIYVITKWLFLALRWTNKYLGNYGLSIVLLTIAIRSAFFPLTYRSAISMRQNAKKMAKIQPRVKAIQERYRKMKKSMETQRSQNDEIMAVYKKEGLNPMGSLGGCLPLLLQMPVFIAFYNLLSVTIELRGAPFLFWIHDLSRMDPYYITPILMGISWMAQQYMTSNTIADPLQRRMMGMMPILFTFMMARMPSGLVIYWLVSNVIGLAQQYVINRNADAMAPAE